MKLYWDQDAGVVGLHATSKSKLLVRKIQLKLILDKNENNDEDKSKKKT